jgi:phosphopantothenoylcysteine decarboxylase/phosphopantothenate--cysteine ligase
MGFALAEEFHKRGANVVLVTGPTNEKTSFQNIRLIPVISAEEMYDACMKEFVSSDIAVLSAAVADYKPTEFSPEKIKKSSGQMVLHLTKTKDILQSLGNTKKENQLLVGFALETDNEIENALHKLKNKNADFIVLNSMRDENATFGHDTNKVTVFDKAGNEYKSGLHSKKKIAEFIANIIIQQIV